jgi:hypothetical protein
MLGVERPIIQRGGKLRKPEPNYTHPLETAHLAASEQTAALVRNAVKASRTGQVSRFCADQGANSEVTTGRQS